MSYTTIHIIFIITYIKTYVYVHKKRVHTYVTYFFTKLCSLTSSLSACTVWYNNHMHRSKESCHKFCSKTELQKVCIKALKYEHQIPHAKCLLCTQVQTMVCYNKHDLFWTLSVSFQTLTFQRLNPFLSSDIRKKIFLFSYTHQKELVSIIRYQKTFQAEYILLLNIASGR